MNKIKFVSGVGQYHTNEVDPNKPDKVLTPYLIIGMNEIKALVDSPQAVDKTQAQWLMPSSFPSRNFKQQEQHGIYWMLWADFDKNPPPLTELAYLIEETTNGADYELYNSRSATQDNPKSRLIIFLKEPLSFADWRLAQELLNDELEALGVIPDRANQGAAQLCYLPNKGVFYGSESKRTGNYFDPLLFWANQIAIKREKIENDKMVLEAIKQAAITKRAALKLSDAPDLIGAFNLAYTVQEWLVKAGYDQRGDSFRHPHSETGNYSASVKDGRVHTLSSSDPLYTAGQGAHDAFSVFEILFHNGDRDAALMDAGDNLLAIGCVSYNKAVQTEWSQKQDQARSHAKQQPKDDTDIDSESLSHDYPTYDQAGFYGIAGEVAMLAAEHSEADPIAVYFSFLTAMATMLGRYKFLRVGDSKHYARLFVAIVGASSRARKGTSFKPVERIIRKVEEVFQKTAIGLMEPLVIANGGMSSSEGLIYAVRDEAEQTSGKDKMPIWDGVNDKRLLVVEEELGGVFKVAQREGNTLTPILRRAWDGGTLAPMTKNNRMSSTDPHINTLGHITQFELKNLLGNSDIYNGLANRFLWVCVRRTKKLSRPQAMDSDKVFNLAIRLADALKKSQSSENNEIDLDKDARDLWDIQYHIISTDRHGVIGAITARNEAHVLRLALLFCLLDGLKIITTAHLYAAIHVVTYSTASAEFIFTVPDDGSPDAQKLLSALDVKPLSQSAISKLFNGHKSKAELTALLTDLQALNKIRKQTPQIGRKVIWEKI